MLGEQERLLKWGIFRYRVGEQTSYRNANAQLVSSIAMFPLIDRGLNIVASTCSTSRICYTPK